ncbi:ABC transporter-like protein [Brachyspira pilosicoli B2904]|uniref:ABC transporter-like protein n=1 Tax=Brachyspira pilosicoli B2904 TaxID=1133568 RepID=J9UGB1_BRAPL|nr:GldG family protein [Brachyspira pilosicoli]AFR70756.1 ABC transporter-like protein [Brachyspira pilosicoli B2904]
MSNKKFNLKIATIASWVLLFFSWIFFYAVTQRPTAAFWVVLAVTLILTAITVIIEKNNIISLLKTRFVHKAFFGILSLIIILAILVGLYIISINFPIRFDLTQNKSYTVSQQTMDVISRIDSPLSIVVLRSPSTDPTSADWRSDLLLDQYQRLSKHITVEYINPIEKPSAKSKYQMTQVGEIIFSYGQSKQVRVYRKDLTTQSKVTSEPLFVGEEKFTQAIYTLLEQESYVVYFTVGHGERQLQDRGGEGLSYVKTYLENENYKVRDLNIILENIPTDASLIVIASPVETFSDFEIEKLNNYVKTGGKLLVLYDSFMDRSNFNSNLDVFLSDWGFKTKNDYIIDPVSSVVIPVNVVPQYTAHPITQTLKEGNVFACLVVARSILSGESKYSGSFENIITTSPQGYGKEEATFDLSRARFNPRTDIAGPVPLAIAGTYDIEGRDVPARIVVFGDATFALNAYINPEQGQSVDVAFAGNKDLFMNTVAYLLEARQKITIRPKEASIKNLTLTTTQTNFIRYVAQIGLPCLFGILGILIWFLRRR